MKKLCYVLLTSFALINLSCSKSSDDSSSTGNFFNYKVDGKSVSNAGLYAYATVVLTGTYGIYGTNPTTGETLYLIVDDTHGVGTYNFDSTHNFSDVAFYSKASGAESFWSAGTGASGTLKITKKTATRVEGSFSFTKLVNTADETKSVVITSGSFGVDFR